MKIDLQLSKKLSAFFGTFLVLSVLGAVVVFKPKKSSSFKTLNVLATSLPGSLDPLNYDLFANHSIQSIFYLRLVTDYRGHGGTSPALAESWETKNSDTEWSFKIRDDVFFKNGQRVDPLAIQKSLKRIIFLLKKDGSKNDFINNLQEIEKLRSPSDHFNGITIRGDRINFHLRRPTPNLLELISFGIFSIVDSENFDPVTGNWKSEEFSHVSGTGPYEIEGSSPSEITLKRKSNYPKDLFHPNSAKRIRYFKGNAVDEEVDLFHGPSYSELFQNSNHHFYGKGGRHIVYVHILPRLNQESPLNSDDTRREFQETFYDELQLAGVEITRSFFPTTMAGIREPQKKTLPKRANTKSAPKGILYYNNSPPKGPPTLATRIFQAFEKTAVIMGFKPVGLADYPYAEVRKQIEGKKTKETIDVAFLITGVSIEDPSADVKLMFSREGINLPDINGTITKELREPILNIQKINEIIYDQTLIWPISRFDLGVWAKKNLDLS